jgi:mono/diheme cytochrome c family protein
MNLSKLVLLAIILMAFTACNKTSSVTSQRSSPAATPTPDEFAATRQVFVKRCAICHGDSGEGKTTTVEGKRIKAPSLRTGHALNHPDSDFVKQITKGGDGMPAFAEKLSAQEINDLVRFIRKDFQGGNAPKANSNMKMD